MKKIYVIFAVIVFLLNTAESCKTEYSDLGDHTFFFYFNGEPQYPVCMIFSGPYMYFQDSSRVIFHFCSQNEGIEFEYTVENFHGPGVYNIRRAPDSPDFILYYQGTVYNWVEENTYIRVLEWDPENSFLSAVFEAHVTDSDGRDCHITKGRFHDKIWVTDARPGWNFM